MKTYVINKDGVNVEFNSYGASAPSRCFNVPSQKRFECEYGAFIVRTHGGDFYVDMGNEIAFRIRPLSTQDDALKDALFAIEQTPSYDTWREFIK